MGRRLITLGVAAAGLAFVTVALTAPKNPELLKDEANFLAQAGAAFTGGQKGGDARNVAVVGHTDLGGRGFNADVWYHGGFAYVGHWGFADWAQGAKNRFCPEGANTGVAVVDVGDPANPQVVSRLWILRRTE